MNTLTTKVDGLIKTQITKGQQIGVQVSAYKDGKKILDTFAGKMGKDDPRSVTSETLFLSFSTTKGVAATAIHMLVDRGKLNYTDRVAKHWPAFGQNGKDRITVEQALSHQVGLHLWPESIALDEPEDWEGMIRYVEGAKPAYPPGTSTGYHALTFGYIVAGIVQSVDGRHIKDFIREEIAEPLGVEDEMMLGLPRRFSAKAATIDHEEYAEAYKAVPIDSEMGKALPGHLWDCVNTPSFRGTYNPSTNGFFSARALARMYGALANGGAIDGVRLVSPGRISEMGRLVTDKLDVVMGIPRSKGLGFLLSGMGADAAYGSRVTCFGHSGAGGSFAYADPEVGLSIAVTLNKMVFMNEGEIGRADVICDLIRKELSAD
jgi:CubicO group peptidase (beta-lactamase class C family)